LNLKPEMEVEVEQEGTEITEEGVKGDRSVGVMI
jgi:hypothetical protein